MKPLFIISLVFTLTTGCEQLEILPTKKPANQLMADYLVICVICFDVSIESPKPVKNENAGP